MRRNLIWSFVLSMLIAVPARARPDDHGNTCATATDIALQSNSVTVNGVLEQAGDIDCFRLATLPRHSYSVDYTITGGFLPPPLRWLSSDCNTPLTECWYVSPCGRTIWTPTAQTFLVVGNPGAGSGPYTARIVDLGEVVDDHPNNAVAAEPLPANGQWVSSSFQYPGDDDEFVVTAARTDWLRVEVQFVAPGQGTSIQIRDDGGYFERTLLHAFTPEESADTARTYGFDMLPAYSRLWITLSQTTPNSRDQLRIRVVRVGSLAGPDDHSGTCSFATPIAVDSSPLRAVLTPNDTDWFSFPAIANRLYAVDADLLIGTGNGWPELWHYFPCNTPGLGTQTSLFPAARLYFRPDTDGTQAVLLRLPYYPDEPDEVPPLAMIELSVHDLGPRSDDLPNTEAGARRIMLGETANGRIDYTSDRDYYLIQLAPMRQYRLLKRDLGDYDIYLRQVGGSGFSLLRWIDAPDSWRSTGFVTGSGLPSDWLITCRSAVAGDFQLQVVDAGPIGEPLPASCAATPIASVNGQPQLVTLTPAHPDQWLQYSIPTGRRYRLAFTDQSVGSALRVYSYWNCEYENIPGVYHDWRRFLPPFEFESFEQGRLGIRFWAQSGIVLPESITVTLSDIGAATDTVPSGSTLAIRLPITARPFSGRLDYFQDVDTFRVTLRAGVRYRLGLQREGDLNGSVSAPLSAAFEGGLPILAYPTVSDNPSGVRSEWVYDDTLAVSSPGTYYIEVLSWSHDTGSYRLRLFNAECPADWNDDGRATVQDLLDYLGDWFVGQGEYDGLGTTEGTIEDVLAYITDWLAGC